MSDEKTEKPTEKPEMIDISAPRPTDQKSINSSFDRTNVQMNNTEKSDE